MSDRTVRIGVDGFDERPALIEALRSQGFQVVTEGPAKVVLGNTPEPNAKVVGRDFERWLDAPLVLALTLRDPDLSPALMAGLSSQGLRLVSWRRLPSGNLMGQAERTGGETVFFVPVQARPLHWLFDKEASEAIEAESNFDAGLRERGEIGSESQLAPGQTHVLEEGVDGPVVRRRRTTSF